MRAENMKANLPKLTIDFDDTLNNYCDLEKAAGTDPRLLAIIRQFREFTILTHRNFNTSAMSARRAIEVLGGAGRGGFEGNEQVAIEKPITRESLGNYFIPSFLENFRNNYPDIFVEVCVEGTAREGFGSSYTEALLAFETELLETLLTLNSNIEKIIPAFKYDLKFLIMAATKIQEDKLIADFLPSIPESATHNFPDFYEIIDEFIGKNKESIEAFSRQLLNNFHKSTRLNSPIPDQIRANQDAFSSEDNVRAMVALVGLQIKQILVSAYESHCDKENGFNQANRNKAKQIEFEMKRTASQQVFHIDDSEKVAKLTTEGVTVFLYEPRCIANKKLVADERAHAWFTAFDQELKAKDPAAAQEMVYELISRGLPAHTEERKELSEKFVKIVDAIRTNIHTPILDKNIFLYRLFFQHVQLFQKSIGLLPSWDDKSKGERLDKDKYVLSFIKSYLKVTGRNLSEFVLLFEMILDLTGNDMMRVLCAQFPEINFEDIKASLLDDLIRHASINPEEHSRYEDKKEYDSSDRAKINVVISRNYQKENKSPEDLKVALDELSQIFSEKYGQVKRSIQAQSSMLTPFGMSKDVAGVIAQKLIDPQQPVPAKFRTLMAFSQTCRFFRHATKDMREILKARYEFESRKSDHNLDLLIAGSLGVGKKALWCRFQGWDVSVDKRYAISPHSTAEKSIMLAHEKVKLVCRYTSHYHYKGNLRAVKRPIYRRAHGVIIAYDVTDQISFDEVKTMWVREVEFHAPEDVKVILVGTKCDLVAQKVVDFYTAKDYADQMGWSFIEVSSVKNINVDLVFETLAQDIIAQKQAKSSPASEEAKKDDDSKCCVM